MQTGIFIVIGAIIAAIYTIYINNRSEDRARKQHARNKTYDLFYNANNIHGIRDKYIRVVDIIPNPLAVDDLAKLNGDQKQAILDLFFELEIPAGLMLIGDLDEKIMFNARKYYEDSWSRFGNIIYLMRRSEDPRYFYDSEVVAVIWHVASMKERFANDAATAPKGSSAVKGDAFVFSWLKRYEPHSRGAIYEEQSHWVRYAPKFQKQLKAIIDEDLDHFPLQFHEGGLRSEGSGFWHWFASVPR